MSAILFISPLAFLAIQPPAVRTAAPLATRAAATMAVDVPPEQLAAGAGAVAVLGAAFFASQQSKSVKPPPPAPKSVPKATKKYPLRGGQPTWHPKRGPWPRDPPRELWKPPKGWSKPTKPVTSWYDRGDRLMAAPPPAPPAPPPEPKSPVSFLKQFLSQVGGGQNKYPRKGGKPTFHPKRGPWPRDPPRELWKPPKGWVPPSRPVVVDLVPSWYDAGKRLS